MLLDDNGVYRGRSNANSTMPLGRILVQNYVDSRTPNNSMATSFTAQPFRIETEQALEREGLFDKKRSDGNGRWNTSKALVRIPVNNLMCGLAVLVLCVTFIICTVIVSNSLHGAVRDLGGPIVKELTPAFESAKNMLQRVEIAEIVLEDTLNRTFDSAVASLPALRQTNTVLQDTASMISSLSNMAAHPHVRIDVQGQPGGV